jgi:2,5-diketo-D-gluconate reductase A
VTARVLRLRGGAEMPQLGLGTWPLTGEAATRAVLDALGAGYRLLDTSEQYGNEEAVGAAIRRSGLPREEIFVTTKFNAAWHGEELATQAFERAAARLGTDPDLLLIHWPNPWLDRYVDAWRGLITLRDRGCVRAIGVSNFAPEHIGRLIDETGEAPEVDQVELDPTLPRREWRAFHAGHGIVTQSWSPLGRAGPVLADPRVRAIAERHGRSPAQIVLRWHVQQGLAVAVGASDPREIREDIDVFGFALAPAELASLDALDEGRAPARDPEKHGH